MLIQTLSVNVLKVMMKQRVLFCRFYDMSKAFDTISLHILLEKLNFNDCLTGGKFLVHIIVLKGRLYILMEKLFNTLHYCKCVCLLVLMIKCHIHVFMQITQLYKIKIKTDCILSSNTKLAPTNSTVEDWWCAANFLYLNREKTDNNEFDFKEKSTLY